MTPGDTPCPTAVIGILGGGQLGRMLALAGIPLGFRFRVLDPNKHPPAADVAHHVRGAYDDPAGLAALAEQVDVVTYEFENVPATATEWLTAHVPVFPSPTALTLCQDRLIEKQALRGLGIPTPDFAEVSSRSDLDHAAASVGLPAVLKTRRHGYDGKGQRVLRRPDDLHSAWETLGGAPLILEAWVEYEREVSIIAVRGRNGETRFYPIIENRHERGILVRSDVPTPDPDGRLAAQARRAATAILDATGYVGVLAIEFFALEGRLIANEVAPRVHNSGHWTIEGAETSQFENHVRAVAGFPLGPTEERGPSAMFNLIGRTPDPAQILAIPGAHLHLYGKHPQPDRKLGHVTVTGANFEAGMASVESVVGRASLPGSARDS